MLLMLSHRGLPLALNLHLDRARQEKLLLVPPALHAIALPAGSHTCGYGRALVVGVQLLEVHGVASAAALSVLNRLVAGPFLCVELSPVTTTTGHLLHSQGFSCGLVRGRNDGLSLRVKSEVSLIHQLVVERIVNAGSVGIAGLRLPAFEEFSQNRLLVISMRSHAFTLHSAI